MLRSLGSSAPARVLVKSSLHPPSGVTSHRPASTSLGSSTSVWKFAGGPEGTGIEGGGQLLTIGPTRLRAPIGPTTVLRSRLSCVTPQGPPITPLAGAGIMPPFDEMPIPSQWPPGHVETEYSTVKVPDVRFTNQEIVASPPKTLCDDADATACAATVAAKVPTSIAHLWARPDPTKGWDFRVMRNWRRMPERNRISNLDVVPQSPLEAAGVKLATRIPGKIRARTQSTSQHTKDPTCIGIENIRKRETHTRIAAHTHTHMQRRHASQSSDTSSNIPWSC